MQEMLEVRHRLCACGADLADSEIVNEHGATLCSLCGTASSENAATCTLYDIDDWGGPNGQRSTICVENDPTVDTQHRELMKDVFQSHLPECAHHAASKLFHEYRTAMQTRKVSVHPTLLAIAYLVACDHDFPLRVDQLTTQKLGKQRILKAVQNVCRMCNIDSYPRIKSSVLIQWMVEKLEVKPPLRSHLVQMAIDIYGCAKVGWLTEGRSPGLVEAATVCVAAQVLKEKQQFDVATVALKLDVGLRVMQNRIVDIQGIFLAAAKRLPWSDQITKANVYLYMPYMLEFKAEFFGMNQLDLVK